jgi:DNA-binding transcriptional regulator GbsR (MarR family)
MTKDEGHAMTECLTREELDDWHRNLPRWLQQYGCELSQLRLDEWEAICDLVIKGIEADGLIEFVRNLPFHVHGGHSAQIADYLQEHFMPSPPSQAPSPAETHWYSEEDIAAAVFGYIKAVRALNREQINTVEIAEALNISEPEVENAICKFEMPGVETVADKVNRKPSPVVTPEPWLADKYAVGDAMKSVEPSPSDTDVEGLVERLEKVSPYECETSSAFCAEICAEAAALLVKLRDERDGWKEYYDIAEKDNIALRVRKIKLQHELSSLKQERDALKEALEDLIEDAERQMANPSHHQPFSLNKARAALQGEGK